MRGSLEKTLAMHIPYMMGHRMLMGTFIVVMPSIRSVLPSPDGTFIEKKSKVGL